VLLRCCQAVAQLPRAKKKTEKKGICGGHEKEKEKRQEKEGEKDLRSRRDT
jgi:hypothetical protein